MGRWGRARQSAPGLGLLRKRAVAGWGVIVAERAWRRRGRGDEREWLEGGLPKRKPPPPQSQVHPPPPPVFATARAAAGALHALSSPVLGGSTKIMS